MTNDSAVDMWVRSTVCLCKSGGDWLIVHEHTSVPFDAESGRAALDLTP
jgi:ketosteroid isomerase-like protein